MFKQIDSWRTLIHRLILELGKQAWSRSAFVLSPEDALFLAALEPDNGGSTPDVTELVGPGQRWLISAERGFGKTWLAASLVRWLATDRAAPVPIYTTAEKIWQAIARGEHPFRVAESELAVASTREAARGLEWELVRKAEHHGVALIVDDIDTLQTSDERARFNTYLTQWHEAHPALALVLFTRPQESDWFQDDFGRLRLLPLTRSIGIDAMRDAQARRQTAALSPRENRKRALLLRWATGGQDIRPSALAAIERLLFSSQGTPLYIDAIANLVLAGRTVTRMSLGEQVIRMRSGDPARAEDVAGPLLLRTSAADFDERTARLDPAEFDQSTETPSDNRSEISAGAVRSAVDFLQQMGLLTGSSPWWPDPRLGGLAARARLLQVDGMVRERLIAGTLARGGIALIASHAARLRQDEALLRKLIQRRIKAGRETRLLESQWLENRWGPILGAACDLSPRPLEALDRLRAADPALAAAASLEITSVEARELIDFLWPYETLDAHTPAYQVKDCWSGDTLHTLAERRREVEPLLWQRISASLDIGRAAHLYYALARLDPERAWRSFFGRTPGYRPAAVNGFVSPLRRIHGGEFAMGSSKDEVNRFHGPGAPDSGPPLDVVREREVVEAPKPVETFDMARVPVTWREYHRFDPDHAPVNASKERHSIDPLEPVTGVNWWRANLFAAWRKCRLPTEREWEFACRATTDTPWWPGDDEGALREAAVYASSEEHPQPVARVDEDSGEIEPLRPSNPFGLADMHGNVWEWCADPWRAQPAHDDPDRGLRVARGGSFREPAAWVRSAARTKGPTALRWDQVGFRLARNAAKQPEKI